MKLQPLRGVFFLAAAMTGNWRVNILPNPGNCGSNMVLMCSGRIDRAFASICCMVVPGKLAKNNIH